MGPGRWIAPYALLFSWHESLPALEVSHLLQVEEVGFTEATLTEMFSFRTQGSGS